MKTPLHILLFCLGLSAGAGGESTPVSLSEAHSTVAPFEASAFPMPQTPLDAIVFGQLKQMGIRPANPCSDAVFVRRVYLDVIGTLPTSDETRRFLQDKNPNKRSALIDWLLERDEFADYWAMRWSNLLRVKSEFPINLWPNAVEAYHRWIRTSIKENTPYDQFVREMLTASGSNFRKPQINFYRAVQSKDPQTLAQTVALTFMGTRAEKWPSERLTNMAVFFSRVGYKTTAEWKEEIVFFDFSKTPSPTSAVFPDGTAVNLSPLQDPREVFADWLISPTNAWFTRNIVNRTWSWLMGRGIINEPDDIRPHNPPVNPELLALLEREFIASKFDFKQLLRLILKSQIYQLSSLPASMQPQSEANFAFYPVQRLDAEVLIDAIDQITGTTEKYISHIPEPFTYIPEEKPSIALADASITSPFLDLFGRSPRNTGLESEQRSNLPTSAQQLHLLNSSHIRDKLEQSSRLRALLQSAGNLREEVNQLYLTILSRYPTDTELQIAVAYSQSSESRQQAGLDLAWALINSAEFQFRH
jgi:hypothetical protein